MSLAKVGLFLEVCDFIDGFEQIWQVCNFGLSLFVDFEVLLHEVDFVFE